MTDPGLLLGGLILYKENQGWGGVGCVGVGWGGQGNGPCIDLEEENCVKPLKSSSDTIGALQEVCKSLYQ